MPPGRYLITSLDVREQVRLIGIGSSGYQFASLARFDGVQFEPFDASLAAMIRLRAGASLESLTVRGQRWNEDRPSRTLGIEVVGGFESRIGLVHVLNFAGPGIRIRQLNNARWHDVYVDACGTETEAAMTIDSADGTTNFNVFDQLTIQHSKNAALDIGWGGGDSNFATNLTFLGLHLESTADQKNQDTLNAGPLLRIGNGTQFTFLSAYVLGLASPLIEHDHSRSGLSRPGAVQFIGGEITQRGTPDDFKTPQSTLVKLTRGTDFVASGTRFDDLRVPAVTIGEAYGAAMLDWTNRYRSIESIPSAVVDLRAHRVRAYNPLDMPMPAVFGEQVVLKSQILASETGVRDPSDAGSRRWTALTRYGGTTVTWAGASGGAQGNDIAGYITIVLGTGKAASSPLGSVTFKREFANPPVVVLAPTNRETADARLFVSVDDGSGFTVRAAVDLEKSASLTLAYHVIGIGNGAPPA